MDLIGIDITHIVDLGTQVATTGAIRALQVTSDELFEYIVGIAILIYEVHPG